MALVKPAFSYEIQGFALPTERKKVIEAIDRLREITSDPDFFLAISQFCTPKGEHRFAQCDREPEEIAATLLDLFRSGHLVIQMAPNPFRSDVAYFENGIIHLSRRCFYRNSVDEVAGSICHESCHKAGLPHSYKPSPLWPLTAPYWIGRLAARWKHASILKFLLASS